MNLTDFSGQRPVQSKLKTKVVRDQGYNGRTLGSLELLRLACPSNTTREPPERNNTFVILDIAEVGIGLREFETCFHP